MLGEILLANCHVGSGAALTAAGTTGFTGVAFLFWRLTVYEQTRSASRIHFFSAVPGLRGDLLPLQLRAWPGLGHHFGEYWSLSTYSLCTPTCH